MANTGKRSVWHEVLCPKHGKRDPMHRAKVVKVSPKSGASGESGCPMCNNDEE